MTATDDTAGPAPRPSVAARPVAVIDVGASAVRLVIAEVGRGRAPLVLEEASRGVPLGKDTFASGRIGAATIEAALKALDGFRRLMDGYLVADYRAVATSAVREAVNADTFLDRVLVRTGLRIEVIDGTEESRLTYLAVRERLRGHPALDGPHALLVEVGGGSADLTFLDRDRPKHSGVYPLGSIRMRQSLAAWHGGHDQRVRLLTRHINNVVGDIEGEMPLATARHMIAIGNDVRFAASRILETQEDGVHEVPRESFLAFCATVERWDEETLVERYRLTQVDAETLVPALLVYRSLLLATAAPALTVPDVSLRAGLLVDLAREGDEPELADFSLQVLASAEALGEKYRYDAAHAHHVARLAGRLFDELQEEHGLKARDRLLLEVAALLHDIGVFVSLRAHHKHSQYLLSATEIFGLSGDDMALVSNVARYHRRGLPQKSHLPYMALDREDRVRVNKLAALLRLANALDAEHMQKVADLRVVRDADTWVLSVEGTGDLTMERLAATSRADLFVQVFGHDLAFRGSGAVS
jgi:exopolyphosphatase/guanosine-5'-triphosphate,3'-diphosphate pyrophosphatase